MQINLIESAKALPLAERVELFDALWETLRQDGYEPALTPAQAAELDCRLEAHRRSSGDVPEIQARPALTKDKAVRIIRDFPQRFDVAVVFGPIDRAGQLLVSFELIRLVGETFGR